MLQAVHAVLTVLLHLRAEEGLVLWSLPTSTPHPTPYPTSLPHCCEE